MPIYLLIFTQFGTLLSTYFNSALIPKKCLETLRVVNVAMPAAGCANTNGLTHVLVYEN
ncbi:hypothetical protein ACWATR_18805 [Nostoc sp. UIC 10890]